MAVAAELPSDALHRALENSRGVFDNTANWQALGYDTAPCLYAIRSLHTEPDFYQSTTLCNEGCMMLAKVASFDELQFLRMKAFEEVSVPYHIIHIA